MAHPDRNRTHRRHRRGTTLVLGVAALLGVLLVLAPAGSADASEAGHQTGSATWAGLPVGALVWLAAGAAVLVAWRVITATSRSAQPESLVLAAGVEVGAGAARDSGLSRSAVDQGQSLTGPVAVGAEALAYCA